MTSAARRPGTSGAPAWPRATSWSCAAGRPARCSSATRSRTTRRTPRSWRRRPGCCGPSLASGGDSGGRGRERGERRVRPVSEVVAVFDGGHRTRTCTGLRPAVFKTAALPVRSSPPDYAALELTAAGVARGVPMFAVEAQRHAEARSASSMMLYRFAPSNGPPQVRWDSLGCGRHRRSEEHTSELQSPDHLVCRLLLEKKKQKL